MIFVFQGGTQICDSPMHDIHVTQVVIKTRSFAAVALL